MSFQVNVGIYFTSPLDMWNDYKVIQGRVVWLEETVSIFFILIPLESKKKCYGAF